MATIATIIGWARKRLHDLPGDVGETFDWQTANGDAGLLWSNADLVDCLNAAITEFLIRRPHRDSTITDFSELVIDAGTNPTVAYSSKVLAVLSAQLQSRVDAGFPPLVKRYQSHDLEDNVTDWRNETNSPEEYIEDRDHRTIQLIGVLDTQDTLLLTVERLAEYEISWDDKDSNLEDLVPEIPVHHQRDLLDWICREAYLNDDYGSETQNIQLSTKYEKDFDARVGPRKPAYLMENQRRFANVRKHTRGYYR